MGGVCFAAEVQVSVDDVRAAVVCTPLAPIWTRRVPLPLPLAILQVGDAATCIAPATLGRALRLEFAFGTGREVAVLCSASVISRVRERSVNMAKFAKMG